MTGEKTRRPCYGFRERILRGAAFSSFLLYLGWNAWWLSTFRVPPSILLGVFGIPAPTTGMTRACRALFADNIMASLSWNAFTLPLIALFAWSFARFLQGVFRGHFTPLSRLVVWLWIFVLTGAWVTKLLQGPAWW